MKAFVPLALCGVLCTPGVGLAAGDVTCSGDGWLLELWPPNARFTYPSQLDFEIKNDIPASGADWPRAMTLIGDRDTAIVILDAPVQGAPTRALVLTQRAGQPILLEGRCKGGG